MSNKDFFDKQKLRLHPYRVTHPIYFSRHRDVAKTKHTKKKKSTAYKTGGTRFIVEPLLWATCLHNEYSDARFSGDVSRLRWYCRVKKFLLFEIQEIFHQNRSETTLRYDVPGIKSKVRGVSDIFTWL